MHTRIRVFCGCIILNMRSYKVLAVILSLFFTIGLLICTNLAAVSPTHDLESVSSVCPPSSPDGPCSSLQEHLSFWQTLLNATPTYLTLLLSILLLSLLVPRISGLFLNLFRVPFVTQKIPKRQWQLTFPKHALQEAFSDGILHPKTY